jgi:hypothetical protein
LIGSQDKDVREAAAHMGELRLGLQDVEASLEESHSRADRLLRVVEETKRRYRAYRHENAALRGERLREQLAAEQHQTHPRLSLTLM